MGEGRREGGPAEEVKAEVVGAGGASERRMWSMRREEEAMGRVSMLNARALERQDVVWERAHGRNQSIHCDG